jgi:hypothetical protein
MLFVKNLPVWERVLRAAFGLALAAYGLLGPHAAALGYAIAGAGAVALLTGFIGFCPMCALVGRRLERKP